MKPKTEKKKLLPIARQAGNGGFNEIKVIILDL